MNAQRDARPAATGRGSVAVPFAIALPVLAGFMGLALDLSYGYTRKTPNSATPKTYLVNPLDPADSVNNTAHFSADFIEPFFCTGTVGLASVLRGTRLHVRDQLREFIGNYANWWMPGTPSYRRTAASTTRNSSARVTFADLCRSRPG